jgi:hypothetical protein
MWYAGVDWASDHHDTLVIAALLDAGLPVYPINPKIVDRRRKPSGTKTDAINAYWASKNRTQ